MSGTVRASARTHHTEREVLNDLAIKDDADVITDESALAIASWYQSSAYPGIYFAQLASTGECDLDEIVEAIYAELNLLDDDGSTVDSETVMQSITLHALMDWCHARSATEGPLAW